mmetsp:Transcript_36425/g.77473  ORF Transcript_36425/g.77473 Transcript_36425/m.77473 type:complete len:117 (-) Transcript_36425:34-384(-)
MLREVLALCWRAAEKLQQQGHETRWPAAFPDSCDAELQERQQQGQRQQQRRFQVREHGQQLPGRVMPPRSSRPETWCRNEEQSDRRNERQKGNEQAQSHPFAGAPGLAGLVKVATA